MESPEVDENRIEIRQRLDETIELFGFCGWVRSCNPSGAVIDFANQGFIVLLAGCDGPTVCSLSFILPGHFLSDAELQEAKSRIFSFFEIPDEASVDIRAAGCVQGRLLGAESSSFPVPPRVAASALSEPQSFKAALIHRFETVVRVVNREYRWDRPPAEDIYSVPRQFDMATVFTMFVAFSLLFSIMLALDASPGLILAFASFFVVVGAAQAVFFDGEKPREASVFSGAAWGTFLVLVGAIASGRLLESFVFVLLAPFFCAFAGYLAGTVNGGIWLVTDYLRQWMIRRKMMTADGEPQASSPFDDVLWDKGADPSKDEAQSTDSKDRS